MYFLLTTRPKTCININCIDLSGLISRLWACARMLRKEGKLRKEDYMIKNFKRIFTIVLVVGFILLVQGCGTDPAVWAAIGQGINSGLTGGSSSGSSSYRSSSSSSNSSLKEYLVIVNGYNTNHIMMEGRYYVMASSQSEAREIGKSMYLSELPGATNVVAMALLN